MNFIVWIIFGALAGWVASVITGKNRKMNGIANVVIGMRRASWKSLRMSLTSPAGVTIGAPLWHW